MKNYIKMLICALLFTPLTALAVNVTVPAAPGTGYGLTSTTTGAYIYIPSTGTAGNCVKWGANNGFADFGLGCGTVGGATSTNPFMATYFVATSTTATSTFPAISFNAFSLGGSIVSAFGNGLSIVNGVLGISPPVSIANGGTNATSFAQSGGILAFDGTRQVNFANYTLTSSLLTAANASTTNLTAGTSLFEEGNRVYAKQDKSFIMSSSTLTYAGWPTATSSYMVWNPQKAITITDLYCKATNISNSNSVAGTSTVTVGSGTASSTVLCGGQVAGSTTGLAIVISARGNVTFEFGNGAGSADHFTPTISFTSQ